MRAREFTLRNEGGAYWKIYHRSTWIGRVCTHAQGGFLGIIGTASIRADERDIAFAEIVARHCGYRDAITMARAVSTQRTACRAAARVMRAKFKHVVAEFYDGKTAHIDALFGITRRAGGA